MTRAGLALLVALVLVSTSITLQIVAAEDLYWEGDEEASNEFLEVKDEGFGIGSHLRRLKRGFWDFGNIFSDSSSTEKPEVGIDETDTEPKEEIPNGGDDDDIDSGSGLPDRSEDALERGDADTESREKTLRVTFVVNQPYQADYNKRDSTQFKTFSKSLSDAVNQLYDKLPGIQKASLVRIQSRTSDEFTCKVTLDIVTTNYDDTENIASILREHIRNRRALGSVAVSETDFSANVIDPVVVVGSAIPVCAADEVTCADGSCLQGSTRCDGRNDCSDGADEEGCPPPNDPWSTDSDSVTEYDPGAGPAPDEPVSSSWSDNGDSDSGGGFIQPGRGDLGSSFDETTPYGSDSTTCHTDELRCDETRCVPLSVRCDGRAECDDGADERDCEEICTPGDFICSDGKCIESSKRCDNINDCSDGGDERDCQCRSNEFTCGDRKCIEQRKVCDGVSNCADNSDELHCVDWSGRHVCQDRGKFRCRDGTCISILLRCDGFRDCPKDGSDEIGCPCSSDQWQCDHGNCIKRSQRCDGRVDCPTDRSDERYCFERYFRCRSGNIIAENLRCNHHYDCPSGDYSDEQNCPCGVADFKCSNGYCIPASKHCDRTNDCQDGSDERDCTYGTQCMAYEHKCSSGQCVSADSVCNGTAECADGSDEKNCPCKRDSFHCRDGTCINIALRCNGHYDCRNGEDELNCRHEVPCPDGYFTCMRGSAVRCAVACDGRAECTNGEDEENCEECNHECDGRCLRDEQICNNIVDCSDESDELHCDDCDGPSDFRCKQSGECLNIAQRCNGVQECTDNSDENNCNDTVTSAPYGCPENMLQCKDGQCVNGDFRCDGNPDCYDGSDEENCPCKSNEWQCDSGACIPGYERCNGVPNCSDRSDERNCLLPTNPLYTTTPSYPYWSYRPEPTTPPPPPTTAYPTYTRYPPYPNQPSEVCNRNEWRCENGPCIQTYRRCDGKVDCPFDSSDEFDCPPGSPVALQLKTYPEGQSVRNGGDVVFQCRDEGPKRAAVRWVREFGRPLKRGSYDKNGRLEMYGVTPGDSGTYICQASAYLGTPGSELKVQLTVNPTVTPDIPRGPGVCQPSQATCGNGECIPKSAICNGIRECSDGSDEENCNMNGLCEPNQFRCDNHKCVLKTWLCDSENDCGDNSDEANCGPNVASPGECLPVEYKCLTGGQCVPKSFLCDQQSDCLDNSDEANCAPAYIRVPPTPSNVRLNSGDTLTLRCEAVGIPVPLISWRLNWGHVPQSCTATSENGIGVLTCHNMQPEHSGAYSCEAINNRKTIFAVPDAIVSVNKTDICPSGYFNSEARSESECIRCFCFGESSQCRSADLFTYSMPPLLGEGGTRLVGVKQSYTGQVQIDTQPITDKYYYLPIRNGATVIFINTGPSRLYGSESRPYLTLPESYSGNQLTSYGGHIRYRIVPHSQQYSIDDGLPDIIIKGKYETLVHHQRGDKSRGTTLEARLTPDYWQKSGPNGFSAASREDIMMALDNIEMILLRADHNNLGVNITDFNMESAQHVNVGLGVASLVEECTCPPGYEGLSCQKCASGFVREKSGPWLGNCVPERRPCPPGSYGDPSSGLGCRPCPCPLTNRENNFARTCSVGPGGGVICDCAPGYGGDTCEYCLPGYVGNPLVPGDSCRQPPPSSCHVAGTQLQLMDECRCKDNVQGRYCDQCKDNAFYLSTDFRQGCALCFCSGVSQECRSSNLRRKTTTARFNTPQIAQRVRVYSSAPLGPAGNIKYNAPEETDLTPTLQRGQLTLDGLDDSRPAIYYWSLPDSFTGDKVTSYGGYLTYTLTNIPTYGTPKNNAADIHLISVNHLAFVYYGNFIPTSDGTLNATVQLLETGWQRADGTEMPREQFLLALADVKAILIKATYSSYSSEVASLESASIDTAEPDGHGPPALHVEQCVCPTGYIGTSCEDCQPGYTRSSSGIYLEHCEPCECNGHSSNCDPESGVCYDCRDNTDGDNCESCKPGYVKNRYDECEPSSDVTTPPPESCRCDPRGSTGACDARGVCQCKQNVEGQLCDACRPGTFGLGHDDQLGCLPCYCSGVSSDCSEAVHYSRIELPSLVFGDNYGGYKITNLHGDFVDSDRFVPDTTTSELLYPFPYSYPPNEQLFWSIPHFLGNRVLSYGGLLYLTQKFEGSEDNQVSSPGTDVVLIGDTVSVYWTNPNPIKSGEALSYQVPLRENGWFLLNTATPANRNDFMAVLSDLKRVLVRATLADNIVSTSIADVSMDFADNRSQDPSLPAAKAIELCTCPEGYTGTSCESCAPHFYRDQYRRCSPCPCNGHDCHLDANDQVICNCRPPYSGRDCSSIGVVMELLPTIHETGNPYDPFRKITLFCKYRAPEPLTIRFYFEGREVGSPKYYYESTQHHDGYHGEHSWQTVRDTRRREEMYSCHTLTATGFTLGALTTTLPQTGEPSTGVTSSTQSPPTSTVIVVITSPTIKIEEVGSSVNFTCQGRSLLTKRLPVQWTKSGGELPQGRHQIDQWSGLLLITNLQLSDSGTYICHTSDGINTAQAHATLKVPGNTMTAPEISMRPPASTYYVGDRVELECSATGNPMPEVSWQRANNYPLPRTANSYEFSLIIDDVQESDAGEYRCIARNAAGSSDRVALVTVRPRTPSRPRDKLTVYPESPSVNEGQSTRLVCTGTPNIPADSVEWIREDRAEFAENVRFEQGVLYVEAARPENQGVYTCQASFPEVAPVSVLLSVVPQGPPPPDQQPNVTTTPNQLLLPTGESGSFDCISHGYPQLRIQWKKHEGVFGPGVSQRGNSLIISNAQESDEGYYICEGLLDNGTPVAVSYVPVTIERRVAPVVDIWPQGEQAVPLNSQFEFQCRVLEGLPPPDITWSRSGGRPLSQHAHIESDNLVLKFDTIEVNDEGEYQCMARNEAGERTASAVLKVRSMPELTITPKHFITAQYGEPVTVECRADGYPEPMVSIKSSDGAREFVAATPGVAVLRVPSFSDRYEGDYVCSASSVAGTVDDQFALRLLRGDLDPENEGSGEDPGTYSDPDNEPASLVAYVGNESRLECNGSEGFDVMWRRVDRFELQPNAVQMGSTLIIRDTSKSDAGEYECDVIDRRTQVVRGAAKMRLQVVKALSITLQPKTQSVRPGQSPTVACYVDGDDVIDITWTGIGGRPLPERVESRGPTLIFNHIEVEDAGQYECVARSPNSRASAVAEVIVSADTDRAPESHENEQFAHVGSDVHLSCNVTQPHLRIRWTKDSRVVPTTKQNRDGSLSIRLAQKSDSGRYVCHIRDRYGRTSINYINLHIEGAPEETPSLVTIEEPGRKFNVGEDVQVMCTASSRGVDVKWERYDTDQNRRLYVENRKYGGGSLLIVSGVQEADAGVYRCEGSDSYGRTSYKDFNLEVNSVVKEPSPAYGDMVTYTARLGDTVDMPCNHDLDTSEGVAFQWSREYGSLPPEVRKDLSNLHLDSVTEADAGIYVCRVNNRQNAVEARAALRVDGVVPRFDGASWIALPTIRDSWTKFEIEISFNPTDPNGLILYNSGDSKDYLALHLKDGVPVLALDALRGEVAVQGDRPLQLNTWHTIRISRSKKKLTMDVDNNGPFVIDNLNGDILELNQPLYIGGVPDLSQLPSTLPTTGFVGCVSLLIIGQEEKDIMNTKINEYNVQSCNTCRPNLCLNNGICQEARNERGYECLCQTGFAGLKCDRTGEACRPGLCGRGKCQDTATGYKCSCLINYGGRNCDVRQQIEYPAFTGSAYLAIKPPEMRRYFDMSLRIKASAPVTDGIIMYWAESTRGYGAFTSLAVHDGRLEFRCDLGDGSPPAVLTANRSLPANEWTTVQIARLVNSITLKINNNLVDQQSLQSPGKEMHLETPLFVGGVDETIVLNNNTGVTGGFNGCIKDVTVYNNKMNIVNSSIQSANVQECSNFDRGDIPEIDSPCSQCQNGGRCIGDSLTCSCPPGYSGVYCETRAPPPLRRPSYPASAPGCAARPCRNHGTCRPNPASRTQYTCDCPLGFSGATCQIPIHLKESVGFDGNGYVELPAELLPYERLGREPVVVALAFHTAADGVLFYQGETDAAYGDHILLRVESGRVVLEWELGSGPSTLAINEVHVTDGDRHMVIVQLDEDSSMLLIVDDKQAKGTSTGFTNRMNANSNIYIGGLPEKYNTANYPGLVGCIEQVELMDTRRVMLGDRAVASRNAQICKDPRRS